MQDKTWYSILGLDAEPLFLQDHMLNSCLLQKKIQKSNIPTKVKPFLFREGFSDYTFYEVYRNRYT